MQIAANTVAAVISYYKKELAAIYSESELKHIVSWILQKQFGLSPAEILANPHRRINESDLTPLERMCAELKNHRPVQYVLGEAEFYGYRFRVNEAVLIPRPETEEMAECIVKDIRALGKPVRVLDIGTGSGCIAVALKKQFPEADVYALDISDAALEVAVENASLNDAVVTFFKADILSERAEEVIIAACGADKFDIVVSNPPYVLLTEKDTLHARVRGYEPHVALFVSDEDPILFYRRIAKMASMLLRKEGLLWFECHSAHARAVAQMLDEVRYKDVTVYHDLSGLMRLSRAVRGQDHAPRRY